MSGNGSGERDPNNPWGSPKQDGPDLASMLDRFFNNPDGSNNIFRYVAIVVALLAVVWALSGIFIVSPAQQGVILRFGKYAKTVGPGLHWIPHFVDSKTVIDVQQVRNFPYSSEMLTKDENIVSVALAVQYRIADPEKFLFNVVTPIQTMQEATSSALRAVVGNMTLNLVLTTGRQELSEMVLQQLRTILSSYQIGLSISDVTLQPVTPPSQVTAAFDDAIKAREDEQRYANQAKAYARRVVSIANGKVSRLMQAAMAYSQEVVLRAKGSTARYMALLKPYEEAKEVTRERLYLDTVSSVLSRTSNILVDSGGSNILYLPINQLLKQQMQMNKAQNQNSSNTSDANALPEEATPSSSNANSVTGKTYTFSTYGGNRPTYPGGVK